MAYIYAPVDAFEYAKKYVKRVPLNDVQAQILDDSLKYMWLASPWRFTLGTLSTTIPIVNGTQDYTLTAPADMLYPIFAYLTDGKTISQYLEIAPTLPANVKVKGSPTRIAYMGSNTWRIYPIPYISGTQEIVIYYKKKAPTVTLATSYLAGLQVFDDEWFWVYKEIVLYYAYKYADDARAGSSTITSDGKWQYTGQKAQIESAIQIMREREKLPIFQFQTAPDPTVSSK